MSSCVLDASALLALLQGEPGEDVVPSALSESIISSVNLAEAASVLMNAGAAIDNVRSTLADLAVATALFDDDLAFGAAALRPLTRSAGLSLGDRACLALAQQLNRSVLTADRSWAGLALGIEVVLIR